MKEAKGFGEVVEVASSAEATYTYIPKDYTIPVDDRLEVFGTVADFHQR